MGGAQPNPSVNYEEVYNQNVIYNTNVVIVSGAGNARANGRYIADGTKKGGRSVWTKEGDNNWKIQWSTQSSVWMIDYVPGDAPYCIRSRDCESVDLPNGAKWSQYMGGAAPNPSVKFEAIH